MCKQRMDTGVNCKYRLISTTLRAKLFPFCDAHYRVILHKD